MESDAVLSGPWLCHICRADREPAAPIRPGLFASLLSRLELKNPTSFYLPIAIREYFEGVQTGENGEYIEVVNQKPK